MRLVTNFITARSRSYWIAALTVTGGLPLLVLLLVLSFRHYGAESLQALSDGRVVIVDIASGRVQGGIRTESLPSVAQAAQAVKDADAHQDRLSPLLPAAAKELKDAPALQLSDNVQEGILPKIGSDGTKPWQYYARPFEAKAGKPVIAVLVTGVGMTREASDAALLLPKEVTLSISPYAQSPSIWAASARSLGHEVMLDLPVETLGFPADDPGPKALLTMNNASEIEKTLRWLLSRFSGYTGVAVHHRDSFSASSVAPAAYKELGARGLMMAHGATSVSDGVKALADDASLPLVMTSLRLDDELSDETVQQQLLELENAARQSGGALVTTMAYPLTVKALAKWSEALEKKGFILAPVSALARSGKS